MTDNFPIDTSATIDEMVANGMDKKHARMIIDTITEVHRDSASRQDVETLHTKIDTVLSQLNSKIETVRTELNTKIDAVRTEIKSVRTELNSKIESVRMELNSKIDAVRTELNAKIESQGADLSKQIADLKVYIFKTVIASVAFGVTIIGVFISVLSTQ